MVNNGPTTNVPKSIKNDRNMVLTQVNGKIIKITMRPIKINL